MCRWPVKSIPCAGFGYWSRTARYFRSRAFRNEGLSTGPLNHNSQGKRGARYHKAIPKQHKSSARLSRGGRAASTRSWGFDRGKLFEGEASRKRDAAEDGTGEKEKVAHREILMMIDAGRLHGARRLIRDFLQGFTPALDDFYNQLLP